MAFQQLVSDFFTPFIPFAPHCPVQWGLCSKYLEIAIKFMLAVSLSHCTLVSSPICDAEFACQQWDILWRWGWQIPTCQGTLRPGLWHSHLDLTVVSSLVCSKQTLAFIHNHSGMGNCYAREKCMEFYLPHQWCSVACAHWSEAKTVTYFAFFILQLENLCLLQSRPLYLYLEIN